VTEPTAPIRYPHTEQGLKDALKALGRSPESVAANLLAMGIEGDREECGSCPVAKYVVASVEAVRLVDANGIKVRIGSREDAFELGYGEILHEDNTIEVTTPGPVSMFIEMFDNRRFPELDLSRGYRKGIKDA
jgi:hypothetical protein